MQDSQIVFLFLFNQIKKEGNRTSEIGRKKPADINSPTHQPASQPFRLILEQCVRKEHTMMWNAVIICAVRLHENQFIKSIKDLFAVTLSLYIVTSTLLKYTTQFENRGIDIFCVPVQNNPEKFNSSQILLKTNQRTHLKAMSSHKGCWGADNSRTMSFVLYKVYAMHVWQH